MELEKLELLLEGDDRLKEACTPWDFENDGNPENLVKELFRVMLLGKGIGLAAPQCGVNKTIFVMGTVTNMVACINPKIISLSKEKELGIEGCLSFPNLWMNVKRPTKCVIEYQNVEGKTEQKELVGLMSRVFLHEFDHLLGITFDERVGSFALKRAKDKRKKEMRKKEKTNGK